MATQRLASNVLASLACVFVCSCAFLRQEPGPLGTTPTTIIVADVGPGNCVLVLCPNKTQILNDCGSLNSPANNASAISLIKGQIDATKDLYVALSHGDLDHYSLVSEVVPDVGKVKAVYIGGAQSTYTYLQEWFAELKSKTAVVPRNPPHAFDSPGHPDDTFVCTDQPKGSGDGMYVLSYNAGSTKNDHSLVLKFVQNRTSATNMGDAEGETEALILENYWKTPDFLHTTMLVSAHHGSSNKANSEDWVNASLPESVIFSAGDRPTYGHPRCEVVRLYETSGRMSRAQRHELTCFWEQRKSITNPYEVAEANTFNSGAVRYTTDGDKWTMEICPGNDLKNCWQIRP